MQLKAYQPKLWTATLLGLVGVLFWDTLQLIFASWQQDEYSYAYFVLPLALWIGLHKLSSAPVNARGSWAGAFVVFVSLCFWAIGEASGISNLPQYGFLGLVYGVFLSLYGWAVVKTVWPALAYLFFAIPLPPGLYLSLSSKMQLVSSDLGVFLLQLVSIPVFQDGNIIDLGDYKLQVVEACNGLRYLFPLVSFGFLFAILLQDAVWKRLTLFLSAIPLAIGLNALRIAIIGMVASWGSPAAAIRIVHDVEGWVAFFACIIILYLEALLLLRIRPRGRFADQFLDLPKPPYMLNHVQISRSVLAVGGFLLIAALASLSGALSPKTEIIPIRHTFAALSPQIEAWHGQREPMDPDAVALLKATDILNMTFVSSNKDATIGLYVAYYDSQRQERTFHSPSVCLPGSGWKNAKTDVVWMTPDAPEGKSIHINRLVIEKGAERQLIYYWFEQRGVSEPSYYFAKGRIILDSILRGRTDGALIRLSTPIGPKESEAEADSRLAHFLKVSAPVLAPFIPDYSLIKSRQRHEK